MHITDHCEYPLVKILVFVDCFVFNGYFILVFVLLCIVRDPNFLFLIKIDNESNQNL